MSLEIELKLNLSEEKAASVWTLPFLLSIATNPPHTVQLRTTYFDTPQYDLYKHGIVLRIREVQGQYIQTWKTEGQAVEGLHQRHEWERPLTTLQPDYSQLPNKELEHFLLEQNIEKRIEPLFQTDFQRTQMDLACSDDSLVEIAVDIGTVSAHQRSMPICELELELKAGNIQMLRTLSTQLRSTLDLTPSNISKAERGYQLVMGKSHIPSR